jgi:hypothetical protein
MTATKLTQPGATTETFKLELSFIEMHILIQAMNTYAHKHGYGQWNTSAPNEAHATAAETFHDELTNIYCD